MRKFSLLLILSALIGFFLSHCKKRKFLLAFFAKTSYHIGSLSMR